MVNYGTLYISVSELMLFLFKLHNVVIVSLPSPVQDTVYSVVLLIITGEFEGV